MKAISTIVIISLITCACNTKNKVQLIISNESQDKKTVDIRVALDKQVIFQKDINKSQIAPDLQYLIDTVLTDGEYELSIQADKGQAQATQNIKVEGDLWIFVTYNFEDDFFYGFKDSVLNSTTGKKEWLEYQHSTQDTKYEIIPEKKGYVRLNPTVSLFIMDKEPIHQ